MNKLSSLVFLMGLLPLLEVSAEMTVANIFSDNMVLQRRSSAPVWGWAAPGETVTVSFKGQSISAVADIDGKWMVELSPSEADSTGSEMEIKTVSEKKTIKNVLVGEVWLCSGQSNMQFNLSQTLNGKDDVASAERPLIRLLTISREPSDIPVDNIEDKDKWQLCTPKSAKKFSAIGYFFGVELSKKLNVPIGLINNSRGGTCAEAWTSYDGIKAEKSLRAIFDRHLKKMARDDFDKRVVQWQKDLDTWNNLPVEERKKWPTVVKWWKKIRPPYGYPGNPDAPAWLFNALINPLIPFSIKGVIWYQGESNVPRGKEYAKLFPAMIRDWRARWRQGDFPFYFVQIVPCREFIEFNLPDLWMAQYETAKTLKNCAFVSPIDIGDIEDPHPKQKEPIGKRLASLALSETYEKKGIDYKSPSFKHIKIENDKVIVSFSNVSSL